RPDEARLVLETDEDGPQRRRASAVRRKCGGRHSGRDDEENTNERTTIHWRLPPSDEERAPGYPRPRKTPPDPYKALTIVAKCVRSARGPRIARTDCDRSRRVVRP